MYELGLLIKVKNSHSIVDMLEKVVSFGFKTCHFSTYVPDEIYTDEHARLIKNFCDEHGIRISMFWAGWPGDHKWDFVHGPNTVGLVPAEYREERVRYIKMGSDFAKKLGVDCIASHAGYIPENLSDPLYKEFLESIKEIASHCKSNGQWFCFETGQETPITLLRTITDSGADNLGVNLDPANLVMYGKGNAVDSLKVFGRYVKGVHIKDGLYPNNGYELGAEVAIGEGDVQMPAFLQALKNAGYTGPLTVEIELDRRLEEMSLEEAVTQAKSFLNKYI